MAEISVMSINIRGLNSPVKRHKFLDFLKRKRVDIALVQETHLCQKDVNRLQNKHYKVAASSSDNTKTKGSTILISRKCGLNIDKCSKDNTGRISYICTTIGEKKIAFVSVYAPTIVDETFFPRLTNELLALSVSEYSLIVGADMNAVLDLEQDRSGATHTKAQQQVSEMFKTTMDSLHLIDIWRLHNPTTKDYTFFSTRHLSHSRIDYMLCSTELRPMFPSIVMEPAILSDHSPIISTFNCNTSGGKSRRWQFNTSLLQNKEFDIEFRAKLTEFLLINTDSTTDPLYVWQAAKGFIRDFTSSFSAHLKRQRQERIKELEELCQSLEHKLKSKFSRIIYNTLVTNRAELNDLLRRRAEFLMHRVRQNYYTNGSKPSRLLALKLKQTESRATINSIFTENGISTNYQDINTTFKSFYSELYRCPTNSNTAQCQEFLKNVELPCLNPDEAEELGQPISLEELKTALKRTKKGKTPGLDGIPSELLLQYFDILGPTILQALTSAMERGTFLSQTNTALISVLHKKGKDPKHCASYRPISLLGTDVKLFSKVLALRLERVIEKLVHPDQTGFIPNRHAADNIRRLMHIIHEAKNLTTPAAVLSLDAFKAFDRLSWSYLWQVLEKLGVGSKFIDMVRTLYANPTAIVSTNGLHSLPFSIERGSRQGCPLSPLLFALSLEPLAQAIRQNKICNYPIKSCDNSISLFADDILLYISNLEDSIPKILQIFSVFGSISGYKINWDKSNMLKLNNIPVHGLINHPIPIQSKITYLGVTIHTSMKKIVQDNYETVLNNVQRDLKNWAALPASLRARVAVVKMNILPRVNFLSAMIPLAPPLKYWKRLDSLIRQYIWNNRQPRLKFLTLQRTTNNGGLALPNFKVYHLAFQLRALKIWLDPLATAPWKGIEQQIIHPVRMEDLAFACASLKKCLLSYGPIITNTISNFRDAERLLCYTNKWHRHTPLWHNSHLMSGNKPFTCKMWTERGVYTLDHIVNEKGLLSFEEIKTKYDIPKTTFYMYLCIRSALKSQDISWGTPLDTHPIWKLFFYFPVRRVASTVYKTMMEATTGVLPVIQIWEQDLNIENDTIDWEAVWDNIFHCSKNPNHQHIHFNICHRTYWTPQKRFKIKAIPNPHCTFCKPEQIGTFLHMVWECEEVQEFWHKIAKTIGDIIGRPIPIDPIVWLLNDDSKLQLFEKQRKIWLAGSTAAKKMIVQRWLPPHSLSMHQWMAYFLDIVLLELSTARINKAKQKTINLWKDTAQQISDMLNSTDKEPDNASVETD